MSPIETRCYITVEAAAVYIGCSTGTVRNMIADGRLTGYRCGNRLVRVDKHEIDANMQPYGGAVT